MKAGKYYVGDLCYVLDSKWDEVCGLTIVDGKTIDGEFEMKDGTRFAMYGTAWGDGVYSDQMGGAYPVDSGTIGCVLLSEIDEDADTDLGEIIEMEEDFETGYDSGIIIIGHIEIQTASDEDYEDEDEDY